VESEVPTLAGNDSPTQQPEAAPSFSLRSAADLDTTVGGEDQDRALDRAAGYPKRVGRHEILGRLGAGGMGVVYTAYDPELDRKLAIKVIRPQGGSRGDSQTSRGRLMREAQAMARVSHPNVITVFDVGTLDDRIYIAMELIDGSTLHEWCRNEDESGRVVHRPWREVVAIYLQAAEGLIAAHAANLVHRDFKPHNVLVGRDGVARVLDFGLARAANAPDSIVEDRSTHRKSSSINSQLDSKLTRTGAMVGTPAYMAPEQIEGRVADARSDQFSFCVSLWEALYDSRPFAGKNMAELSYAVLEGKLRSPPPERERQVPRHIHAALERGLSSRASERFPDMESLSRALAHDLSARRRRRLLAISAFVGVALVGALLARAAAGPNMAEACRAGSDEIDVAWGPLQSDQLHTTFTSSGLSFAASTQARTRTALDAYALEWKQAFALACDATHEAGTQSPESLDLRMICLSSARSEFEASVAVLAGGTAPVIAAADEILASLPSLSDCANLERLRSAVPAPSDPELEKAVQQARSELAEIVARRRAGDFTNASAELSKLRERGIASEYGPFMAELSAEAGTLALMKGNYAAAEADLKEAYWQASEQRQDALAASSATWLITVVGEARARADDGLDWWRNAKAAYARIGVTAPPSLHRRHAALLREQGKYREAAKQMRAHIEPASALEPAELIDSLDLLLRVEVILAEYEEARTHLVELRRLAASHFGGGHPRFAKVWHAQAELSIAEGKWEDAQEALDAALEIEEAIFGEEHPNLARTHGQLSDLHRLRERGEAARDEGELALRIAEATVGPDHPLAGELAHTTGLAHIAERDLPAAHAMMERARVIAARVYGEQSVEISRPLLGLGTIAELRKEFEKAEAFYQRALSIRERELGRDHPRCADVQSQLGNLDFWRHDYDAAADHYFRTLEIREQALGPDHPAVPIAIMHAAGSYDYTGDLERAGDLHARALERFRAVYGPDYHYVATAALNLSRVRERQGRFEESLELTKEGARVWGPDHDPIEMAYVYTLLGRAYVGLGRPEEAIEPLEGALRIREETGPDLLQRETVLADTRFALGRALWGTKRAKARALIAQARAGYERAGPYASYERGEVERWDAEHP
jgi:serine/threonine protein kinase/tetratricopeptide (TPR) repeat protein